MSREILFLLLASLCYLGGFVYAVVALRNGTYRASWWKLSVLALGFALQTGFLHLRGQAIGGCPMSSPFELLTFVSWAVVLFYFVVGPAYRLSLLGVFTAPLAFLFQLLALLRPEAWTAPIPRLTHGFWPEMHAALSLVAYGAFGLACAAGVMFLMADRQLKKHKLAPIFRHLPPIHNLTRAMRGLILTGTVLLTAGIACAYRMETQPGGIKLAVVWLVWAIYFCLTVYDWTRGMSARRAAWASVTGFLVPVMSLWIVSRR